jgi:hypothetical protein
MRVAVISDTHIPSRASAIPEWVVEEVRDADHVVHAGDFDSRAAYDRVVEIAPALTAVHGNVDPDLGLETTTRVEVGGVEVVVTHGTGAHGTWPGRVAGIVHDAADPDHDGPTVGVAGHTHTVTDVREDGVRLLNPGSATGADPATETSMMVLEADDGDYEVTTRRA